MKIIIIGLMCLVLSACKYEEGPSISFRSEAKRIEGTYDINKFTVGGKDSTHNIKSKLCYSKMKFSSKVIDGNMDNLSCRFTGGYDTNNNYKTITMIFVGPFPNTEPLGTDWILSWEIIELRDKEMTLKCYYHDKLVILELKE